MQKPYAMTLLFTFSRTGRRTESVLTHISRAKHDWRVSGMFPGPPGGVAAQRATGDAAQDSGSLSQKLMLTKNLLQGASHGTFHLLPSTTRALEKLYRIIDREMHAVGAQKMTMPCISSAQPWLHSGRWELMGSELFTLRDRKEAKYCLAPTHEEAVTSVVAADAPISYKRLPIMLYQIGRKFRDEMRPKSGLLRCREFEMKDLYIFDENEEKASISYEKVCDAYDKIFTRLGLNYVKVQADTGAMGGSLSHEFQLLADVGEDTIYTCQQCGKGFNKELIDLTNTESHKCKLEGCGPDFKQEAGIEVAHAFLLGTRYSSKFNAIFTSADQKKKPLFMGCYGIGVTRLIAAALEVSSLPDEIRWPRLLTPYQVIIIPQKEGHKSDVSLALSETLYRELSDLPNLDGEVVLDDRLSLSIGKRLYQARQLGYPLAIVAGKQSLEDPPKFEVVDVYSGHSEYLTVENVISKAKELETISLW